MLHNGDVKTLLDRGLPWPFVLLCLLLTFTPGLSHVRDLQFVELFAGDGAVTSAFRGLAWRGHARDLRHHAALDVCRSAGFALAALSVLRIRIHGILAMGPVCSSWVWINRSSSAGPSCLLFCIVQHVLCMTYFQLFLLCVSSAEVAGTLLTPWASTDATALQ